MNPIEPRLQAALDAAMTQIRGTAAAVATRVCESLGVSAAASTRILERDAIIVAQQELRRNLGVFQSVFFEALRDKVRQELAPRTDSGKKLATADWQSLSLVDDREVEERMNFERIGQLISHECEWQLRELAAFMGTLTGLGRADEDKNPLRGDVIGAALYRGIEATSSDAETRKILARDLGQAMAAAMPACYADVIHGLQERGVQRVVLTVRTVEGPGHQLPGLNSAYAGLPPLERNSTRSGHGDLGEPSGPLGAIDLMYEHRRALTSAAPAALSASPGTSRGHATGSNGAGPHEYDAYAHADTRHETRGGARSRMASPADAQLMDLLRRLTAVASRSGEFNPAPVARGSYGAAEPHHAEANGTNDSSGGRLATHSGVTSSPSTSRGGIADFIRTGQRGAARAAAAAGADAYGDGLTGLMAVNLIHAHREELMQASTGKLDHMVIDVVGSLFDQILSDSRVPPQMARQIARLQLPVLRVALNDQSFFSTRRHPVRRFINRIASLACAFEDFDEGPGKLFLTRVAQLVQEIVEGDFDQIELYAAKLAELERFIAEQTEGQAEQTGAVTTLANKESELHIQQRYMQQLQAALAPLELPDYLGGFLAQVWTQALVVAARRDGPDGDRTKRFRRVGRDIVMSIQPKGSPMFRKKFLMQLPPLMKDLNEGMQLIGWPEAAQREFFGKLLPAHAESLKGKPLSELDHNLMVKQVEAIFALPIPGSETIWAGEALAGVEQEVIERRFTADEAKQVGLVQESAVDWDDKVEDHKVKGNNADSGVDIELDGAATAVETSAESGGGALAMGDNDATLGPAPTESGEAAELAPGAQLIDHVKVGFAYQMHLKDEWQKVRLAHVSTGRSFFVFTRGAKHQETISMTSRMLARMCETGRMRAVENAYLMERATERARKQLAELKAPSRH